MPVHASIKPLEWENHFFALNSGIVHFSSSEPPLTVAQLSAWQRVQAKIPASSVELLDELQALGFRFVEGEVDFTIHVSPPLTDVTTQLAQESDIASLRLAAARLFHASRFRAPWYQPDASGRFYAQWIENAVRGTFDNECLLIRQHTGELAGFVSLRELNEQDARIGLLASLDAGQGTGARLMSAALNWCWQRGIKKLRVATQSSNIAAQRLYIRSGALCDSNSYWLYR